MPALRGCYLIFRSCGQLLIPESVEAIPTLAPFAQPVGIVFHALCCCKINQSLLRRHELDGNVCFRIF